VCGYPHHLLSLVPAASGDTYRVATISRLIKIIGLFYIHASGAAGIGCIYRRVCVRVCVYVIMCVCERESSPAASDVCMYRYVCV